MLVRRIDDIGRVAIPKEIRRILGICEGDELDIDIYGRTIIIKKHSDDIMDELQFNIALLEDTELRDKLFKVLDGHKETVGETMTDRDRLIELLLKCDKDNDVLSCFNERPRKKPSAEIIADYLIENGVILTPCKVGDTVYSFCDTFGVILPYFIENFAIGFLDKDRNHWFWEANSYATETYELLDEIDFDLDDIGKTVFLTREEAEKALERSAT